MRRHLLLSMVLGLGVLVVPGLALADGEPDGTSTKAPEKASDGRVKNAAKRRAVRRDRREAQRKAGRSEAPPRDVPSPANRAG